MRVVTSIMAVFVVWAIGLGTVLAAGNSKGEMQMETDIVAQELLGKTFDEILGQLGPPVREKRFMLGPAVPEFRIELKKFFDDNRRESNPPEVREVTWSLSPDENLTIWFTRPEEDWRALHYLSWHPGDPF